MRPRRYLIRPLTCSDRTSSVTVVRRTPTICASKPGPRRLVPTEPVPGDGVWD
jgi:hypothetical protein